jgi:hypothetical protein
MDFHKTTENNKMSLCILEILGDNKLSKLGRLERTSAYKGVFFVENEHSIVFVHCMVKDVICKLLVLKHPCLATVSYRPPLRFSIVTLVAL